MTTSTDTTIEDPENYDYEDWCDPIARAFCDGYEVHERHVYGALNGRCYDCPGLTATELADLEAYYAADVPCEHGLSGYLCSGPNHYGEDERGW